MQLASTSTPRSATSSVTCSYDSGYRRYQRTHKTITSPGYWRPLNGLCGLIGMDFYPIRLPAPKFATEPSAVIRELAQINGGLIDSRVGCVLAERHVAGE